MARFIRDFQYTVSFRFHFLLLLSTFRFQKLRINQNLYLLYIFDF